MTTEPAHPPVGGSVQDQAEAKRLAARRRFLARGTLGPAMAVVTLCHQRAFGQARAVEALLPDAQADAPGEHAEYQPQGILVSSELTCQSLHGQTNRIVTVIDSVSHRPVSRVDCVR